MSQVAPVCCADRRGPRQPKDHEHRSPKSAPHTTRTAGARRPRRRGRLRCFRGRAFGRRARAGEQLGALAVVHAQRAGAGRARERAAGRDHELAAGAAPAEPHRSRSRRPGTHRVGGRVGRPRDAPQPPAPVRRQRLLPPSAEPRLLRLAARLRARGVLRIGHRGRARPLQPAVPVRLVAVLRWRLPARARARPWARRRGGSGCGVRLRALPRDGGLPLALFLLLRGYRRSSRGLVLAGWLVSAWQISLGFTLGMQYAYLLLVLALLAVYAWWRGRLEPSRRAAGLEGEGAGAAEARAEEARAEEDGVDLEQETVSSAAAERAAERAARRRAQAKRGGTPSRGPLIPRHLLVVTVIGIAVLGAVTVYQSVPYLKVASDYPTAKRTIKEVKNYSAGPAALLAASSENRVWGAATAGARAHVHSKNESVFFPGGLILVLAIVGLAGVGGALLTRRLRIGLALGIVVVSILALGMGLTGAGYPYRWVYDYAPGWNGVRVPGRIFTLATLFYALLAGAGAAQLAALAGRWGERRQLRGLAPLLGAVLAIAIVGEGAGHLGHPVVPQPARAEIGLPGPLLDLPTDGAADRVWQYFSTDGFYEIPVGNSTFDFPAVDDLRGGMSGFPDRASVEKLRYYGIRTVVLHLHMPKLPGIVGYALAEPPNPAAAAAKPIAGLGITRERVGSLVIYRIGPGPAALHS